MCEMFEEIQNRIKIHNENQSMKMNQLEISEIKKKVEIKNSL